MRVINGCWVAVIVITTALGGGCGKRQQSAKPETPPPGTGASAADHPQSPDTPSVVRTMLPIDVGSPQAMRVVWIDPQRAKMAADTKVALGDLVRFESPTTGSEIAWSRQADGLDVQLVPETGLVYRLYQADPSDKGKVPHYASEISPADSEHQQHFWIDRGHNMLPLPLFFVACPENHEDVLLDPKHSGLSVSYIRSPYDWGVVLASPECLLLIRGRVTLQREWLALDLCVFNLAGPEIESPPLVAVVMEGENLGEFPPELADKIVPADLTIGEFQSTSITHAGTGETDVHPLGIGGHFGYSYGLTNESGASKTYSIINPTRWMLATKCWSAKSGVEQGSYRRGLFLFKPPQGNAESCTVTLKTSASVPFASLEFKGFLSDGDEVRVPGSAFGQLRFNYSKYRLQ